VDFSQALDKLKQGRKLQRQSWNGTDQWVVRQNGYPEGIPLNFTTARATGLPEGSTQTFEPYFMLYTVRSTFVPWVPTAGDLNADDWTVFYMPGEEERLRREETDAILADQDLVAELEAAEKDPASYSAAELKMAVALRALEREDLPDREDIRFRLVDQLLRPVFDNQRQLDLTDPPRLHLETVPPQVAEITRALVGVITQVNADLTQTKLILDATQVRLAQLEADQGVDIFDDGFVFDRLMAVILPSVARWRQNGAVLGEGTESREGWCLVLNGKRDNGVEKLSSMEMKGRDLPTPKEEAAFAKAVADIDDPERTQHLVSPGDPEYPQRPQRRVSVRYYLTMGYNEPEREVLESDYWAAVDTAGLAADAAEQSFQEGDVKGRIERVSQ
jgi:hypothetical protein